MNKSKGIIFPFAFIVFRERGAYAENNDICDVCTNLIYSVDWLMYFLEVFFLVVSVIATRRWMNIRFIE
jgi:hypothetical protein